MLGISAPLVGLALTRPYVSESPLIYLPPFVAGITAAAFYGSRVGVIYKVPPKHRTPPASKQPDTGKEASGEQKDPR